MASSNSTDCPDLVQAAKAGDKVQRLVQDLPGYFRVEDIVVATGYSKVQCVHDESQVLAKVREEFKKELGRSKKVLIKPIDKDINGLVDTPQIFDILQTIIPSEEKKYYITFGLRLLVFQSGLSSLEGLVGKDDCIILIPAVIIGPATATLEEQGTGRRTTFEFKVGSEFILSGQCSMEMQPESKAVCVVLSIGRNKE
jgi:hypothetical protein